MDKCWHLFKSFKKEKEKNKALNRRTEGDRDFDCKFLLV